MQSAVDFNSSYSLQFSNRDASVAVGKFTRFEQSDENRLHALLTSNQVVRQCISYCLQPAMNLANRYESDASSCSESLREFDE